MAASNDWRMPGIGYVMLGTADIARSLALYKDLLGLDVISQIPGFAFLNTGAATLCLSEQLGTSAENLAGATEVVFVVDDIDEAYERLIEKGVEFYATPHQTTETDFSANFRDPDGHRLSIFGPKSAK